MNKATALAAVARDGDRGRCAGKSDICMVGMDNLTKLEDRDGDAAEQQPSHQATINARLRRVNIARRERKSRQAAGEHHKLEARAKEIRIR